MVVAASLTYVGNNGGSTGLSKQKQKLVSLWKVSAHITQQDTAQVKNVTHTLPLNLLIISWGEGLAQKQHWDKHLNWKWHTQPFLKTCLDSHWPHWRRACSFEWIKCAWIISAPHRDSFYLCQLYCAELRASCSCCVPVCWVNGPVASFMSMNGRQAHLDRGPLKDLCLCLKK